MKIKIDKQLILEAELKEILEFEDIVSDEDEDDGLSTAALLTPAALGIAGGAYAINKPMVDKKVAQVYNKGSRKVKKYTDTKVNQGKEYAQARGNQAKARIHKETSAFSDGVGKGYDAPGQFQKNGRSSAEILGHKLGQGTRRFQKRAANVASNVLNTNLHRK